MTSYTKILFLPFSVSSLVCYVVSVDIFVTRGRKKDTLEAEACSGLPQTNLTSKCHSFVKDCQWSCICENGTTLLSNAKGEFQCIRNVGTEYGCSYGLIIESLDGEKTELVDRHKKTTVGFVGLRYGRKSRECFLSEENSTFWNVTKWSPLFTNGRRSSDFYFLLDILYLSLETEMKKDLYKGLIVKLTIQCSDDPVPNFKYPKSCVAFKIEGTWKGKLPVTKNGISLQDKVIGKGSELGETSCDFYKLLALLICFCAFLFSMIVSCCYLKHKIRVKLQGSTCDSYSMEKAT